MLIDESHHIVFKIKSSHNYKIIENLHLQYFKKKELKNIKALFHLYSEFKEKDFSLSYSIVHCIGR